jgi:transposase
MLTLAPRVRVFVAPEPIDLHLSFDRLAGIVRNQLRGDPLSGDLFAFFNKTRTRTKILVFDGSGYALYDKRLERGAFQLPVVPAGATRVEVDAATLAMILEGIDLRAPRRLRYRHDAPREHLVQT